MKCSPFLAYSLLFVHLLHGQRSGVQSSSPRFHWSLAGAEELNYRDTLAASSQLSESEKRSLAKIISRLVQPFMDDQDIQSDSDLELLIQKTRVKLVDLNGDGIPEVLLQPSAYQLGCGATGNCTLWVFQKRITGYKLILDTRDRDGMGGIELITVTQARTRGFRDLILASHISATEKTLELYRFRRDAYKNTECYLANWEYIDKEKFHSSRRPLITRGCQ
jgi:hypothetical protein